MSNFVNFISELKISEVKNKIKKTIFHSFPSSKGNSFCSYSTAD